MPDDPAELERRLGPHPVSDRDARRGSEATCDTLEDRRAIVGLVHDDDLAVRVLAEIEGGEHARQHEDRIRAATEERACHPAVRIRHLAEARDLPLDAGEIFEIGGRLMPEPQTRVDVGELLRTIGFSAAPGMLRVFGIIPEIAWPVFVLTTLWMLVAMVVAVRQALDYNSTARAIGVCVFGLALALLIVLGFSMFATPLS